MNTTVVTVDKEHPDERVMEEAGRILKEGGLVAFPTETVYGLGGDGLNPDSSRKIYQANICVATLVNPFKFLTPN